MVGYDIFSSIAVAPAATVVVPAIALDLCENCILAVPAVPDVRK
jgi:hypothetical protein